MNALNYVRISKTEQLDAEGEPICNKPYVPALVTRGCGCCSEYERATPANVDKAISDAKEFILALETLRSSL